MKLTKEHADYLMALRDSGVTNMWGAAPFLHAAFPELTLKEARAIHIAWIESF
jgi:hypothetical protein